VRHAPRQDATVARSLHQDAGGDQLLHVSLRKGAVCHVSEETRGLHPPSTRKKRWPNTASGASRRTTFLAPSSLWTGESTPKRYSSRSSIKRLKAQLEAKKAKEALQLQ
jgi:hypothetical protein